VDPEREPLRQGVELDELPQRQDVVAVLEEPHVLRVPQLIDDESVLQQELEDGPGAVDDAHDPERDRREVPVVLVHPAVHVRAVVAVRACVPAELVREHLRRQHRRQERVRVVEDRVVQDSGRAVLLQRRVRDVEDRLAGETEREEVGEGEVGDGVDVKLGREIFDHRECATEVKGLTAVVGFFFSFFFLLSSFFFLLSPFQPCSWVGRGVGGGRDEEKRRRGG